VLLLGGAGSGKTHRCIQLFKEYIGKGKEDKVIFILPRRSLAQKVREKILAETDGYLSRGITTFSDLAEWVCNISGPSTKPISAISKRLILTRTVKDVEYFRPVRDYPGFIDSLIDFIKELKENLITPSTFKKALQKFPLPAIKEKKEALITVYERYQQALKERGMMDEEDILSNALRLLSRAVGKKSSDSPGENLADKEQLIVDGFYSFTPVEYRFLEKLVNLIPKVQITLPFEKDRSEVYEIVEPTYRKLLGFSPSRIEWLKPTRWKAGTALSHIEKNLFGSSPESRDGDDSVTIMEVVSDYMEVEKIAKRVRDLALEGHSFGDFGIILRDIGHYSNIFRDVFEEYSIPFEIVGEIPLSSSPLIKILLIFLRLMLGDWRRDNIIEFLRSRYSDFDRSIADKMEIEACSKGIDRGKENWLRDWGLREIDRAKRNFLKEISELQDDFSKLNRAHELSSLCLKLIEELKITNDGAAALQKSEELRITNDDAAALQKLHDLLREITLHYQDLNPGEFCEILDSTISSSSYSVKEKRRNKVLILNAYDGREEEFSIVFICNLLEKQFPRQVRENPFFRDRERRAINKAGVIRLNELLPKTCEERYLFYVALTRAKEKAILSFPRFGRDGELLPSFYLGEVRRIFTEGTLRLSKFDFSNLIPAPEDSSSLRELLSGIGYYLWEKCEFSKAIIERGLLFTLLLRKQPDLLNEIVTPPKEARLTDRRILEKLATSKHPFSPTQLETFARCPYRHFCNYVLRIKELVPEATPLDRGLIVHEVLTRFYREISPHSRGLLSNFDEGELREKIVQIFDNVFANFPVGGWQPYQVGIQKNIIRQLLEEFIKHELKFEEKRRLTPRYFELAFGQLSGYKGEELDPASTGNCLEIQGENAETIPIRGRMDRVDVAADGGRAVVIDYKSGRGAFSLDEVREGLSLQLPIYAIALKEIFHIEPVAAEIYSLADGRRRGIYQKEAVQDLILDKRNTGVLSSEEFSQLLEDSKKIIVNYAHEIRQGKIAVEPKNCRGCPYSSICGFEE